MKNFRKVTPLLVLVLAASIIGLSGCQIFAPKQPDQLGVDKVPQDRRIGVIQSLGGVNTSTAGTNLLTMDDGTTMLLKSVAINLSDPKYSNKKVEVSGIITYTTDGKQLMVVQSIDVLEDASVTQQVVQPVTWRDYLNAGLGFTVKYRDDFKLAEADQKITFTRSVNPNAIVVSTQETPSTEQISTEHNITIAAQSHTASQTLAKDFLKLSDEKPATILAAGYSKSRIGANGIDAYKKVTADGVSFSFERNGRFFQISYTGGNDSQSLEDQNIFYDFLGSFQFLGDQGSTQQLTVMTPEAKPVVKKPTPPVAPAPSTLPAPTPTQAPAPTPVPQPAPLTTPVPPTPVTTTTTSTGATQETLPGYSSFSSSGYKFSLQFPKNWYYGQAASTDTTVIRRYDFGSKPVDTTPGTVNLDIVSGGVPSGNVVAAGDKTLVQTSTDGVVTYYYTGKNGRVYRVSGPSTAASSLQTMLETLTEQ